MKVIDQPRPKVSLNLLGGGITGAFFHFGVLAALDDHLSRKSVDYDVYVGTSAGSLVATYCALGVKPQEVVEAVLKEDRKFFHIKRRDIYRFSLIDWGTDFGKLLWTLFYWLYMKIEHSEDAPSFFWVLKDALPAGFFSMRYYENWISKQFKNHRLPSFFSELSKELYIPSYNLDACSRTVFGRPGFQHISFGKAITASSAIPIFFEPVSIEDRDFVDGGIGDMAHLDICASAKAELVIVINPMVPVRNDLESVKIKTVFDEKGKIRDKGFTYVFDQTLRLDLRQRLHQAIHHMGYEYPGVDVLLIEPDDTDPTMFLFNPMEFESRKQIVQYAYDLTKKKLRQHSELWSRTLDKHGITLVGVT
ncbi:MAG: patatin-like phospholipase family protein [Deltaproteobacteria bacterium]|nr:patatin-like phospholipase family protein [Deltaproteobacteria bacterium]